MWWSIVEGVRVPSAQTDRPRPRPSQQVCVSLFDVSDRGASAKYENGGMADVWYSLFVQAFISFLKFFDAVLAPSSSTSCQFDVDLPSFKFGMM
jgi:hypothetical protein